MTKHHPGLNEQAANAYEQTLIECQTFVPNTISTGHLLLGLIAAGTKGACAKALRANQVSIQHARIQFGEIVGVRKSGSFSEIIFTPRAQQALDVARTEALRYKQSEIGTEHVLLGLIADDDDYDLPQEECRAPRLLKIMQVDLVKLQAVLEASMDQSSSEETWKPYQPITTIYVQDCRSCGEQVSIKATVCKVCQAGLSELHFRPCPVCAEWIRREAIRCRFCRHELEPV
jgi:ATP-dependent Clp protease ATP-binding subunit ClpA